jgi:hypothetical protein
VKRVAKVKVKSGRQDPGAQGGGGGEKQTLVKTTLKRQEWKMEMIGATVESNKNKKESRMLISQQPCWCWGSGDG